MAPTGRVLLVAVEHDAFSDGRMGPPFNVSEVQVRHHIRVRVRIGVGVGIGLGPPFNVSEVQVRELFGEDFAVELLQREDRFELEPTWRKRGCTHFAEVAYLLTRRPRVS